VNQKTRLIDNYIKVGFYGFAEKLSVDAVCEAQVAQDSRHRGTTQTGTAEVFQQP
jgi:hypothetical protein